MSMIDILKQDLGDALHPKASPLIEKISKTITTNVPDRMKYTISASVLMYFAGQFRRNAELLDGTFVPSNFISVIAAGSGAGKDSSYQMAYKAFSPYFKQLQAYNDEALKNAAIEKAREAGESFPTEESIYKQYLLPSVPTETMFTTAPGVIELASRVMDMPYGAPLIKTSEMSDEYSSNKDTEELVKTIATLYDLGNSPAKITKTVESRSKEVSGIPLNAMLMGSYNTLVEDESVRRKFINSVVSKLGRRSFFVFHKDKIHNPVFSSSAELLAYEDALDLQAEQARASLTAYLTDLLAYGLKTANTPIKVSKPVDDLFKIYRRYNSDIVDASPNPEAINCLVRLHNQWRALKLATTFAFADKSDTIELKHYTEAIQFVELLAFDMEEFEREIHKADHERLADFLKFTADASGHALISIHDLKKKGFTATVSKTKLQELATLANAYDSSAIYSVPHDATGIQYEALIKSDLIGISFKPINLAKLDSALASGNLDAIRSAKSDIAATTAYGFEVSETSFADLANLLTGAFAYSPFKFTNGIRGKDHISGAVSWVVLDVDKSPITANEAHFMLSDLQHLIALSSDPTNFNSYRVLIKLDAEVNLSSLEWRTFMKLFSEDLGIQVDLLPQSQVYFSYPNRTILTNLDAEPYQVHALLARVRDVVASREAQPTTYTSAQAKALLTDKLTTFAFAFEAKDGSASRQVIRAIYYAKLLGASMQYSLDLFDEIQDYWERPFSPDRQDLFRQQITRMY